MAEITPVFLKQLCKERKYYWSKPELNDVLHLTNKGLLRIQNLDAFTGLKCLYLEGNAFDDVTGLDNLKELRSLYLAKNALSRISTGLLHLDRLVTLDLSYNFIRKLENLAPLPALENLVCAGNALSDTADVEELRGCRALVSLDLSDNKLSEPGVVDLVEALPLKYLRLAGNPVVSKTPHYRKRLLANMPALNFLDDAPAFDKDVRMAKAFMSGGFEAERAERQAIKDEAEETRRRHRERFDEILEEAKRKYASNPPEPRDPMRFRAVPPGESESEDDSDLPPSCRISRKGLAQAKAASAAAGGSATELGGGDVEDPDADEDAKPRVSNDGRARDPSSGTEATDDGAVGAVEQGPSTLASTEGGVAQEGAGAGEREGADAEESLSHSDGAQPQQTATAQAEAGAVNQARAPPIAPPLPRAPAAAPGVGGLSASKLSGIERALMANLAMAGGAAAGVARVDAPPRAPVTMPELTEEEKEALRHLREEVFEREMQHRQELREKVLARAAARAEATSRRFTARGASGSIASAGAGREGEDEEVGVQLGAQGSSYRRPVVYGTQRYHQLWEMAKEVPERPEAEDGAVAQGELEGEASDAAWGATAVSEERRGVVRGGVRRRGTGTGLQEEDSVRSVPVHAMAGEGDELDGLD